MPLTAPNGGYVSFVGIRGEGVRGILAVDDVTLYRSDCPSKIVPENLTVQIDIR